MKKIQFLCILFLFMGCTRSIDPKTTVKKQAMEMSEFLMKKDFPNFCKYTHPKLIEVIGGQENMQNYLSRQMESMEATGLTYLSIETGEPSKILTVGNELQCTLPQTVQMDSPKGKITTTSTLICISENKGKNWYFINANEESLPQLKQTIPTISNELAVPPMRRPDLMD